MWPFGRWSAVFLVGTVTMFTIGCGSLSVNVPGPLIESPELPGASGKIDFGFGAEDSTRYTHTDDASRRPPTLTSPEINTRASLVFARGGYSLTDWLEVGLRYFPSTGGNSASTFIVGGLGLTARAQIFGAGTTPGWKMSAYGGLLQSSAYSSGDQNGNFGAGGYKWTADAKAVVLTAGSSIGYRFEGYQTMIYLAGSYADQRLSGTIDHSASDNGLSPAAKYALNDIRASTRTAALGLRFGSDVQLGVEGRVIHRSWPGTPTQGGESTESAATLALYFH